MITKEEFEILKKYENVIEGAHEGRSVSMTRQMYMDVSPMLKQYYGYSGSLMCRYCVMEMFGYCYSLLYGYEEPVEKCVEVVEKSKGKGGRHKGGRPKGSKNKSK